MTTLNHIEPFRQCPRCAVLWRSRQEFLGDPGTVVAGYQVHFDELELGLFLFNHTGCETTFAVQARAFSDLYDGPMYRERKTHTEECKNLLPVRRPAEPLSHTVRMRLGAGGPSDRFPVVELRSSPSHR